MSLCCATSATSECLRDERQHTFFFPRYANQCFPKPPCFHFTCTFVWEEVAIP